MHPVERLLGAIVAIPRSERALVFGPRAIPLFLRLEHARRGSMTERGCHRDGSILRRGGAIGLSRSAPVAECFLGLADPERGDPCVIASWISRQIQLVPIARARVV